MPIVEKWLATKVKITKTWDEITWKKRAQNYHGDEIIMLFGSLILQLH